MSVMTAEKDTYDTDMEPEYDFSGGVRGKYANRFAPAPVTVALSPDVAAVFPNALAVNRALRLLIEAGRTVRHEEAETK